MIIKTLRTMVLVFIVIIIIGVAYPFFMTLVGQIFMPYQANGSLLYVDGKVVGSELIGQSFTSSGYFHGRPSAVDYDGANSSASNLGPTSAKLMEQVKERIEKIRAENNLAPDAVIPADLVLASGSGLDPHISPESALLQVGRVAKARKLAESEVKALVESYIESPQFGFMGTYKVNVLKLNIALDEFAKKKP
jgi:potassium-transporting ATPase KdpC subunit